MNHAPKLSRFEPYEVTANAGLFILGSFGAAVLHTVPPAAERVIPTWGLYLFFVMLALTSAVTLLGIIDDTVAGMNLRRGASIATAGLCVSFTGWTLSAAGITAYRSVIFLLTITVASLWQALRIHRALRPRRPR